MLDERPAYSICVCVRLVTQSCQTLCDPMDCSLPGSSVHGDSPGKNTGVKKKKKKEYWSGLPCPPPEDLPNPGLPNCRQSLYHLSHQGSSKYWSR